MILYTSKEFSARVFDSFERERTSTVSNLQGTGLGMAITRSIVDMMGGTIDVDVNREIAVMMLLQRIYRRHWIQV